MAVHEEPVQECTFRTLLVTGGCGFIGSNFVSDFHKMYPMVFVVNVDMLDYCAKESNIDDVNDSWYKLYRVDVCDTDVLCQILRRHQPSAVVHFAAQTHVDNSFGNSLPFTRNNVVGTHSLLEACRKELLPHNSLSRFVHISTDEVYGEVALDHPGCCERLSILNPTNPYAATKAAAEFIVRSYHHSYNIPVLITRGNNVYGPRQYPEKLIPRFICQHLRNEKFTVQGTGSSRRNFVYVQDVSRAITTILNKGVVGSIYNIGGKSEFSVMEIAEHLRRALAPEKELAELIQYVPDRNFNDQRYAIKSDALRALGWEEEWDFQKGLKATIAWYKKMLVNQNSHIFNSRILSHTKQRQYLFWCKTGGALPGFVANQMIPVMKQQGRVNVTLLTAGSGDCTLPNAMDEIKPDKVIVVGGSWGIPNADGGHSPQRIINDSPLDTYIHDTFLEPIEIAVACKERSVGCVFLRIEGNNLSQSTIPSHSQTLTHTLERLHATVVHVVASDIANTNSGAVEQILLTIAPDAILSTHPDLAARVS